MLAKQGVDNSKLRTISTMKNYSVIRACLAADHHSTINKGNILVKRGSESE